MDGGEEAAELRIANVRGLVMALQAIKPAKPQARQPSGVRTSVSLITRTMASIMACVTPVADPICGMQRFPIFTCRAAVALSEADGAISADVQRRTAW